MKVPYCNFEVCICNDSLTDVLRVGRYCGCEMNWAGLFMHQGSCLSGCLVN